MGIENLNGIAGFMKSFSNPVRLDIIHTLQGKDVMTVSEIVVKLGAKQCHVSQQLNYLTVKKILERRRIGHNVYYSLRMKHVVNLLELVQLEITNKCN